MRRGIQYTIEWLKRITCLVLISLSLAPLVLAQESPRSNGTATGPVSDAEIQRLIQVLGSEDAAEHSRARNELIAIKSQAIPALIAALSDPDEDATIRTRASSVLASGLPSGADAIPAIMRILGDRNLNIRLRRTVARNLSSIIAIGAMEPGAKDRLSLVNEKPVLIKLLKDKSEDVEVRAGAAWALREINPDVHMALPTLLQALQDDSPRIRSASLYALGRIGATAPEVVEPLIVALDDDDENVRAHAAGALGEHRGDYERIIEVLNEAYDDDSATFRLEVVRAFANLDTIIPGVVPALIRGSIDEHEWVRELAVTALGKADPNTSEVIPALIGALDDQYAEVKASAALALGSFGPQARDAIPALTRAILTDYRRSEAYYSEDTIVQALRAIGADMAAVVRSLEEALSGSDIRARRQAAWALAEIGAEGLPALARALTVPGLLEVDELRWELGTIEYPLETTPNLSQDELRALIQYYTAERDRLAASKPEQPKYIAETESTLAYLRSLEDVGPPLPPMIAAVVIFLAGSTACIWIVRRRRSGRKQNLEQVKRSIH